jgi:hypothetical protein
MNRFTVLVLGALALGSLPLVAGCNGAQYMSQAPLDAGPPCSSIPVIISCDAAAPPSATACTAEPTSSDPNVARIPNGNYPAGCEVQFYFDDLSGGCEAARNPCTCLATDGGAQWSNCADAGITPI